MKKLVNELQHAADKQRAVGAARFFKTGPGQYGEGDVFIGISNPKLRKIAKRYSHLSLEELKTMLSNPIHEYRLVALIIMVNTFKKSSFAHQDDLYSLYLWALKKGHINNWDLIDLSAPNIIGEYLLDKPTDILDELAASSSIWEKRVAILSTAAFLRKGDATQTLRIVTKLVDDKHDLIQKAAGWLLREVGKRNGQETLTVFLDKHATTMPRTALRYSIERLSPELRAHYMQLKTSA